MSRFEAARRAAEEARRRYEDHDPYTYHHSVRVAHWAVMIAGHVPGFSQERLRRLEVTALLHDYGKTFLDPAILRKTSKLDDAETAQMRRHPALGADHLPVLGEYVLPEAIRWHHKHFDGSGYPDGVVRGIDLPLEARLIAVADVFDALTSERPYRRERPCYSPAEALDLMKGMAGRELDPSLVALFESVYRLECERVGGEVGSRTLQVQSVIGQEVQRARDLLLAEIGPYDPRDPLKGRPAPPGLVDRLVEGLVRANLDPESASLIAKHVLKMPLPETFAAQDVVSPPRKVTVPPGGFLHHVEVVLRVRRLPPRFDYMRVVVFMGQLWLSVGERSEDEFEVRLAR